MQVMQVNTQAARRGGGLDYKWILAMVVILGVFMSILDQTIVNIAIPRLQTAFGADIHSVQWVLTAYILTQGVVTPTTAFFADRFGTKRFYIIALTLFTAGSAMCGLAWSLPILIFFRVLQGVGGACLFPLAITMLYREFPPQQRGLAGGLSDRVGRPFDPGAVKVGTGSDEALGGADLDHRKAIGMEMRAHGVDDLLVPGADHEAQLQDGAGATGNRVRRMIDIAR